MVAVRVMDETPSVAVLPAPVVNPDMSEQQLVLLAREMVMRIKSPADVLAAFSLSQAQFDTHIMLNRFYKRAFETLLLEWEAAGSTNKRIAFKTAVALEDSLPTLNARMNNAKETLPAVVETAKLFAKLSGAGEEKRDTAPGEKFTITINLGEQRLKFEETVGPTIEGPEIQLISERPSPERALPSERKTD